MSESRPNIVFIFTDEQYAGAMSCAGNADVATPAMDRLATEGTRFENTYCPFPLCSPARASLITGLWPHQAGVYGNKAPNGLTAEAREGSIGNLLSANGYECYYGGKWHLLDFDLPAANQVGFTPICGLNDPELADHCIELFRQDREKPFLLFASFDNPHNILEAGRFRPLPWGNIPEVPTADCPGLPANFAIPPYEPEAIREEQDRNPFGFRARASTPDDWRRYRHQYYRLVEKVDAEIARLLDGLRECGLEEDTVIIFSSDHGDGLGAHQWNQKWVLYEESVRVPMIVRSPYQEKRGVVRSDLVSNGLDLYPTICDYAGVNVPEHLTGLSLRPLVASQSRTPWRDHVCVETFFDPCLPNSIGTHGRMVRTERYKYVYYSWGKYPEQLFDLQNDAGEMVNLAVESRHKDTLAYHRQLMVAHLENTGDRYESHYAHPRLGPRLPWQSYQEGTRP